MGVLGLALCACGDDGKTTGGTAPDALPVITAPSIDAAIPVPDAPMMAPPPDAPPAPPLDAPPPPPDAFVPPNLVPNPGLEADASGWANNGGGAQVARSTVVAHSGVASLLTTVRSGNWNGPAADLTQIVVPGRQYSAQLSARLVNAGTESIFLSTRYTCSEDNTQRFNSMTNRTKADLADNATWGTPASTFTVPAADGCTLTNFIIYVETGTATAMPDFYIDDVSVVDVTP
jgi:hypothetical protein